MTVAGHELPRHSHLRASALIGVLTLLLGFAIAVQFRSTSNGDALAGARPDDLISILDDQNREATRLRARIADLQRTLQRLRDAGTNGPAARVGVSRRFSPGGQTRLFDAKLQYLLRFDSLRYADLGFDQPDQANRNPLCRRQARARLSAARSTRPISGEESLSTRL